MNLDIWLLQRGHVPHDILLEIVSAAVEAGRSTGIREAANVRGSRLA